MNCPFPQAPLPRMQRRCHCRDPKENNILSKRTEVGVYKDTVNVFVHAWWLGWAVEIELK